MEHRQTMLSTPLLTGRCSALKGSNTGEVIIAMTNFPKPELIHLKYLKQKEIYLEREVRLIMIKEIQKCVLRPHLSPLGPLGRHWGGNCCPCLVRSLPLTYPSSRQQLDCVLTCRSEGNVSRLILGRLDYWTT